MKRRTEAEWRALFDQHQASGLTAADFCREYELSEKYFSLKRRKLGLRGPKLGSGFVAVAVTRPVRADTIEVQWDNRLKIQLPISVQPHWLSELLHALRD